MNDRNLEPEHKNLNQIHLVNVLEEYINLPRIVKAVQITPEFALQCMDGHIILPRNMRVYQCARIGDQIKDFMVEFTMEAKQGGSGKLYASFNDWIVCGTASEWYPVNNEIFNYKYAKHQLLNTIESPYTNG
jgi:hypothetical protein